MHHLYESDIPKATDITMLKISDTRKPRLTLKHINQLRHLRELRQKEMDEREKFFDVIYARPAQES